jgi:hypothetical protein
MWHSIKVAADAVVRAVVVFFYSAFFFIMLGCLFIIASYMRLTVVGACGERLLGRSCLQLSQLNLAFGLVAALLGIVLLIYGTALHAAHEGQISGVKQVYSEIKSFFASPLFFILFGTLFLYCGVVLLDETHSGFVFILAVLGIALILFGTGSQAVASGVLPDETPGRLSVGIAGGAAVLAAIFGYGIVHFEPGIQDFFKRTIDYGFFELTTTGTSNQTIDLDQHIVSANTDDGRPLHLWKETNRVHIIVPRYERQQTSTIVLTIRGPRVRPDSKGMPLTIDWQDGHPSSFANERIFVVQQKLTQPLAAEVPLRVDDFGNTLPTIAIPPPQ